MNRIRTLLNRAGCGALVAAALAVCAPAAEAAELVYGELPAKSRQYGNGNIAFAQFARADAYRGDPVAYARLARSYEARVANSIPHSPSRMRGGWCEILRFDAAVVYASGAGYVDLALSVSGESIDLLDGGDGFTLDGLFADDLSTQSAGGFWRNESFHHEEYGDISVGDEDYKLHAHWVFYLTFDLKGHARGLDDVKLSGKLDLEAQWGVHLWELDNLEEVHGFDYDTTLSCNLTTRHSDLSWNWARFTMAPMEMKAGKTLTDTIWGMTVESVITIVDEDIPGIDRMLFDTRPYRQQYLVALDIGSLDTSQTDLLLASPTGSRFDR